MYSSHKKICLYLKKKKERNRKERRKEEIKLDVQGHKMCHMVQCSNHFRNPVSTRI